MWAVMITVMSIERALQGTNRTTLTQKIQRGKLP